MKYVLDSSVARKWVLAEADKKTRKASKKRDLAHLILAADSPEWFIFYKTHVPGTRLVFIV